jgi:hypothetical protein
MCCRCACVAGRAGQPSQAIEQEVDSPRHFGGEHAFAKRLCGIGTRVYIGRPPPLNRPTVLATAVHRIVR